MNRIASLSRTQVTLLTELERVTAALGAPFDLMTVAVLTGFAEAVVRESALGFVSAGWMSASGGLYSLTDEGRAIAQSLHASRVPPV